MASIAMGANYGQSVKALTEAEAFPGTSMVLAYSPCIEHGIQPNDWNDVGNEMTLAVGTG